MLSKTHFIVCSFTSNVRNTQHVIATSITQICRMLYELQQAKGANAARVYSLEVRCITNSMIVQGFWFYHFHKSPDPMVEVTREGGEGLRVGDRLRMVWSDKVDKNVAVAYVLLHQQGIETWKVDNLRTKQRQKYPLFSTKISPNTFPIL